MTNELTKDEVIHLINTLENRVLDNLMSRSVFKDMTTQDRQNALIYDRDLSKKLQKMEIER